MRRSRSRTPVRRFEALPSADARRLDQLAKEGGSRARRGGESTAELRTLVFKLASKDTHKFFQEPVDAIADGAPDYSAVISEPMDFTTLLWRVESGEVVTLEEVRAALLLLCSNACHYNANAAHPVHAAALQLRAVGETVIDAAIVRRECPAAAHHVRTPGSPPPRRRRGGGSGGGGATGTGTGTGPVQTTIFSP